ncbi:hypothetical protein EDD15DRAFT_297038 [Pisolithus albus]|nr:hypothetical protein EDD15DRAFT_297038 [Pisolithus albus]
MSCCGFFSSSIPEIDPRTFEFRSGLSVRLFPTIRVVSFVFQSSDISSNLSLEEESSVRIGDRNDFGENGRFQSLCGQCGGEESYRRRGQQLSGPSRTSVCSTHREQFRGSKQPECSISMLAAHGQLGLLHFPVRVVLVPSQCGGNPLRLVLQTTYPAKRSAVMNLYRVQIAIKIPVKSGSGGFPGFPPYLRPYVRAQGCPLGSE